MIELGYYVMIVIGFVIGFCMTYRRRKDDD